MELETSRLPPTQSWSLRVPDVWRQAIVTGGAQATCKIWDVKLVCFHV